jgi:hypothetical protein
MEAETQRDADTLSHPHFDATSSMAVGDYPGQRCRYVALRLHVIRQTRLTVLLAVAGPAI